MSASSLWGEPQAVFTDTSCQPAHNVVVFHDETGYNKEWKYYGYLLCDAERWEYISDHLVNSKMGVGCECLREIHFVDLSRTSRESRRTAAACSWIKNVMGEWRTLIKFYFFGIHCRYIDWGAFGPASDGQLRRIRMANRFFEMGLFSACRWFYGNAPVTIHDIYCDQRNLAKGDPFLTYTGVRINRRSSSVTVACEQSTMVDSCPERASDPRLAHMIDLTDVLVGAMREALDHPSRAAGKVELGNAIHGLCSRLVDRTYNKNSRYYKVFAMGFFPSPDKSRGRLGPEAFTVDSDRFYTNRALKLCQPSLEGFL